MHARARGVRVVTAAAMMAVAVVAGSTGSRTSAPPPAPTFAKDVAPILFDKCIGCHRAGEIGPMPLTSFADARPWARAIRAAVTRRVMPPWPSNDPPGTFANDPRLTAAEIDTIVRWVDRGAPEGDRADLPRLPGVADGWRMGPPDLVFAPGPFTVAAGPRSVYGDLAIPTSFPEDRYVSVAEVRPGLPAFTHHANLLLKVAGGTARVASYSPGAGAKSYPAGVAKLIPRGATLNLNMHYNPQGEARMDPGTRIGIAFAKGPVRQIAITAETGTNDIDMAPFEPNYERIGKPFVFEQDSHILTLGPRMNERGKDFRYTLVLLDGSSRVLLDIPRWSHGWVLTYVLREPVAAPKGSRLESIAHWDNSAANRDNPDPSVRVPFGPEIMNGYFEYTLDRQDLTKR